MSDCLINSILSYILTWELKTIGSACLERHGVVYEVKVLLGPLFVIFNELIVEVTLGELIGTVLIVLYSVLLRLFLLLISSISLIVMNSLSMLRMTDGLA